MLSRLQAISKTETSETAPATFSKERNCQGAEQQENGGFRLRDVLRKVVDQKRVVAVHEHLQYQVDFL